MACADLGEVFAHEFGFAFTHQAGVDVRGVDSIGAEGAEAESAGDGGIDASADEEKDIAILGDGADLIFHREDLTGGVPIAVAMADVEEEVRKNRLAAGGMGDFGMKLHRV